MVDRGHREHIVSWGSALLPPASRKWVTSIIPGDRGSRVRRPLNVLQTLRPMAQVRCTSSLEHGGVPRTQVVPSVAADSGAMRRLLGMRVLVVEDEALVALDLQFALEDEGAIVIGPALSLPDALELLACEPHIDGAILDVDLAGIEVYPAADLLRARGIPFVFHTGHGSRVSLSERFPGSLTCSKPTTPATLITALLQA